jgi:hypothetical protein
MSKDSLLKNAHRSKRVASLPGEIHFRSDDQQNSHLLIAAENTSYFFWLNLEQSKASRTDLRELLPESEKSLDAYNKQIIAKSAFINEKEFVTASKSGTISLGEVSGESIVWKKHRQMLNKWVHDWACFTISANAQTAITVLAQEFPVISQLLVGKGYIHVEGYPYPGVKALDYQALNFSLEEIDIPLPFGMKIEQYRSAYKGLINAGNRFSFVLDSYNPYTKPDLQYFYQSYFTDQGPKGSLMVKDLKQSLPAVSHWFSSGCAVNERWSAMVMHGDWEMPSEVEERQELKEGESDYAVSIIIRNSRKADSFHFDQAVGFRYLDSSFDRDVRKGRRHFWLSGDFFLLSFGPELQIWHIPTKEQVASLETGANSEDTFPIVWAGFYQNELIILRQRFKQEKEETDLDLLKIPLPSLFPCSTSKPSFEAPISAFSKGARQKIYEECTSTF